MKSSTMKKFLPVLTAAVVFIVGAILFAQLPGPPVGVPQTSQNASHGYNFAYTFVPTGADGSAINFSQTLRPTTATGITQDLVRVNPTFILGNSSTAATTLAGVRILTPTLTLNSGSATNLANMKIEAAGAGATNNYSLWVVGPVRFDSGYTGPIVNPSTGATQTLTAAQCGQSFAFDRSTGVVYTLPVPVPGCTFDFITTVAWVSGAYEVDTALTTSVTLFMQGIVNVVGTTTMGFAGSPVASVAVKSVGTTTGGAIGGHLHLTAISTTLWDVQGTAMGSGTVATPFAAAN